MHYVVISLRNMEMVSIYMGSIGHELGSLLDSSNPLSRCCVGA